MQRWEYASFTVETRNPGGLFSNTSARLIFFRLPKSEGAQIKQDRSQGDRNIADAIARAVAQLGADGWEMVSADEFTMYFKRPI